MTPIPPTAPAPRPCAACGKPVIGRLYCPGTSCKNLAWQRRQRASVKASHIAEQIPLTVTMDYQTPAPDRTLFCPPCGKETAHRPDGVLYACRVCSRLRMTPEQSRRIEREYPAYRVETEQAG